LYAGGDEKVMSILVGKPEGKRPLLTPRLGREGNTKKERRGNRKLGWQMDLIQVMDHRLLLIL
jgi:hypothetical protein